MPPRVRVAGALQACSLGRLAAHALKPGQLEPIEEQGALGPALQKSAKEVVDETPLVEAGGDARVDVVVLGG
eukprot:6140684-Lingulodinium_polyedra.AAC.1